MFNFHQFLFKKAFLQKNFHFRISTFTILVNVNNIHKVNNGTSGVKYRLSAYMSELPPKAIKAHKTITYISKGINLLPAKEG